MVPTAVEQLTLLLGDVPLLEDVSEARAIEAARNSLNPETWKRYVRAWAEFARYAELRGQSWLPAAPETVRRYLLALNHSVRRTGRRPSLSLIEQHAAAIATMHRLKEVPIPMTGTVRATLNGFRRERRGEKARPPNRKAAILHKDLALMVRAIDAGPQPAARRDRDVAMLLLARQFGLRRSEVTGLRLQDLRLRLRGPGYVVTIPWSKTDQTGTAPAQLGLPLTTGDPALCAARRLARWLEHLQGAPAVSPDSPVFRAITQRGKVQAAGISGKVLSDAVIAAADAAGLAKAQVAGHSLRRGFVTEAFLEGHAEAKIQAVTRHKSADQLRNYRDEAHADAEGAWEWLGALGRDE